MHTRRAGGVLRLSLAGLLFVLVSVGSYGAALAACTPPATTVFFVNGLNNTMEQAAASRDALAQRLGSPIQGDCVSYALAYNFTGFPLSFDPETVEANVGLYRTELALGNRVILVAHSNGNVYADEAYDRLSPVERSSVGVVAVATLLGSVPGDGPYITLIEDALVAPIPGHLPPNTTNTGGVCPEGFGCHDFVRFYLNGTQSGPKIIQAVSDTLVRLVRPQGKPSLALSLNQPSFRAGDTLRAGLRATNPGPALTVDFYFGVLWPDGVTISFVTGLSPLSVVTVTTGEPDRFAPLARNVAMPQGLDSTFPDVLVAGLAAGLAPGQWGLFAAITTAGTLNVAAPVASAAFTFAP